MKIDDARKLLRSRAKSSLFLHARGVEESALKLALLYGVDTDKASLAGLLHDYGKIYPYPVLYQIALEHALGDALSLKEPALLHAPVGAWLLQHELGIEDKEILEAVKVHTTGAERISRLAGIVYLADCIEPGRDYPEVDALRNISGRGGDQGLEKALLSAVDRTIVSVLARKRVLHPNSILFRNSLILNRIKTARSFSGYEAYQNNPSKEEGENAPF